MNVPTLDSGYVVPRFSNKTVASYASQVGIFWQYKRLIQIL